MKRCPITNDLIRDDEDYSERGLRMLSPQLTNLQRLQFSAEEQRKEAILRAGKMSVQGVQSKLSAQLKVKENRFKIVDQCGRYILKPQSEYYEQMPENEALTMSLAATIGIEVPVHGLIYSKDNSFTYFIKRFDRVKQNSKLAVEDFAQLTEASRDTKYNSSMEKVAETFLKFCSFPRIEAIKLFKLTLFNFLIGNEDMHLKNFSLITRERKIGISPAYDLLNTNILNPNFNEDIALPLNGKKNNLKKGDLIDYFGGQRLQLNTKVIANVLQEITTQFPLWNEMIAHSFLSQSLQEKYVQLLKERIERLGL